MAIGGSLRAALRAGNWAKTAMESRRRARALADLNARGGVGGRGGRSGPEGAIDYLRNTGVDPAANQRFMDTGQMYAGDFNPAFESGRLFGYDMPGGRIGFLDPVTRSRQTQAWRGGAPDPIQAPYEGFRVLPEGGRYDARYGEYSGRGRPGPWQGRGRGTNWGELPVNGFDAADGSYFEQFPGPRPLGGPLPWDNRPAFPWQMFADTGVPTPTRPGIRGMQTIPFDEIMSARGSLLGDPRFGPYIPF